MKPDAVTGCEALGGCSSRGPLALAWVMDMDWYDDDTGRFQYLCRRHYAQRDCAPRAQGEIWRTPPFTVGAAA